MKVHELVVEGGRGVLVYRLELEVCLKCGAWILPPDHDRILSMDAWLLRDLRQEHPKVDEPSVLRGICHGCVVGEAAVFLCALCKKEVPHSQVKDAFGDPAEYLCKPCYETVPAEVWEREHQALYDRHRHDYE